MSQNLARKLPPIAGVDMTFNRKWVGSLTHPADMKFARIAFVLAIFLPLALSGCSSGSSGEDSDEYKMNQYYDCVQRYESQGLYTSDEIENVCGGLRP